MGEPLNGSHMETTFMPPRTPSALPLGKPHIYPDDQSHVSPLGDTLQVLAS